MAGERGISGIYGNGGLLDIGLSKKRRVTDNAPLLAGHYWVKHEGFSLLVKPG